jgi:hypothetical protein
MSIIATVDELDRIALRSVMVVTVEAACLQGTTGFPSWL